MIQKFNEFLNFKILEEYIGFGENNIFKNRLWKDKNSNFWDLVTSKKIKTLTPKGSGLIKEFNGNNIFVQLENGNIEMFKTEDIKILSILESHWECELMHDKDLESQANNKKFKNSDLLKNFLSKNEYDGKATFNLIKNKEAIKSKTVELGRW